MKRTGVVHGFTWGNQLVSLSFHWDDGVAAHVSRIEWAGGVVEFPGNVPIVELLTSGTGHWIANDRLVYTQLGRDMRYVAHRVEHLENDIERLVIIVQDPESQIRCEVGYELGPDTVMFRTSTKVTNLAPNPVTLEQVTSWTNGFGAPRGQTADACAWELKEADFDWLGEARWHATDTSALFPRIAQELTGHDPRGGHSAVSTGTWSTGKYSPLAVLESRRFGLAWIFQIEHNGAWRWEVGGNTLDGYIALAGPTNINHSWSTTLAQGQSFTTVPASAALASSFDEAYASLVSYRRARRWSHSDNARPRVIFNDYMNTINGDPTTDKLLPLIEAAGKVGIEVFCIDAGWYDDSGDWWPSVGAWQASQRRFPNGISEVIDAIKSAGMIPGIWVEPEVIGVKSPMSQQLPESAFFQRNGRRVVEQERYLLDLRDRSARAHLDSVIDRLVNDYGIGYFKFDYNISSGAGTDYAAASSGDGLLGHNRAYLDWIEGLHRRFPEVILENCSSGGMREDFAQTSRFQVQSTSDQQDYRLYPPIASSSPMMVLPEQSANWAYPQASMTDEQVAFNLNTTMLGRFFLSGYINRMNDRQRTLCVQAIEVYKRLVQPVIGESVPFWPSGLPGWNDAVVASGLRYGEGSLVTVWARDVPDARDVALALPQYAGDDIEISTAYPVGPEFDEWHVEWNSQTATGSVRIPAGVYASRTFIITRKGGAQ